MKDMALFSVFRSLVISSLSLGLVSHASAQAKPEAGWPNYGNDGGGTRYSPAAQIDRTNVTQLKVAWTHRTGALPHDEELDKKAAFEATPILVDGKLFLSTPYDHVIALNPETGAKLWEFDPKSPRGVFPLGANPMPNRGNCARCGSLSGRSTRG